MPVAGDMMLTDDEDGYLLVGFVSASLLTSNRFTLKMLDNRGRQLSITYTWSELNRLRWTVYDEII